MFTTSIKQNPGFSGLFMEHEKAVVPPFGCTQQCVSAGADTWTGQHSGNL